MSAIDSIKEECEKLEELGVNMFDTE